LPRKIVPPKPPGFDAEVWLDATAPALGLNIDPDWRHGVLAHLSVAAAMAALVAETELDTRVEPAPVFRS
jgi:hypothetical protein